MFEQIVLENILYDNLFAFICIENRLKETKFKKNKNLLREFLWKGRFVKMFIKILIAQIC